MTKVVICDDSAFMREVIAKVLEGETGVDVVGSAADPYEARDLIKATNADVLTLDVEMPRMDGLTFLEKIMRLRPMPVVMVSTLTARGADVSLAALEMGALDVVHKPANLEAGFDEFSADLRRAIHAAARANVHTIQANRAGARRDQTSKLIGDAFDRQTLFAVGASTGGVEALLSFVAELPANTPPTVIVQHMPASFTGRFAQRLDKATEAHVVEARHGQLVKAGECVVARGGVHLTLGQTDKPGEWRCSERESEPVSGHRPSVDVLFQSLLNLDKAKVHAAVLTGMGADGAQGLTDLRAAGAATYAQDERSALVYGMPRVAKRLGGVQHEGAPGALAQIMLRAATVQPAPGMAR